VGAIVTTIDRVCRLLWISGAAVIVASWLGLVTPAVGWIGLAVAVDGPGCNLISNDKFNMRI
jgi:hypothetical protein